ncbi:MAG: sulfur carrier protein ThiS [Kiritimatiellia bacterium]|jgi:thiamine biosynthesis protein ThiS
MQLIVNGDSVEYKGRPRLADLLAEIAPGRRVAALVNGNVVPMAQREEHELHEGDRIEILEFAGGG